MRPLNNLSHRIIKSISTLTLLLFGSVVMADSVGCDDNYVQLNNMNLVIEVTPTGVDDTINIQRALPWHAVY